MTLPVAQPWRALWFLYTHSWRNRLVLQLRRLRQPRYIVGALAMLAYVVTMLQSPAGQVAAAGNNTLLDGRELFAIIGLALSLGAWWLAAPSDSALAFSPAEIHFLFPAPVKRRTLVQARLFSVQAVLLVQVLIWSLLLHRGGGDLPGGLRAIGLWVLFTTISLHRLGATLARTHAPDVPRRRPVAKSIAVLYLAAMAGAAVNAAPAALTMWRSALALSSYDASQRTSRLMAGRIAMQAFLNDPLVHALVWPIRAITTPTFAPDAGAWLLAMPGAVVVLLLHYGWILRDPQPFEELAVGTSARFAERVASMRRGGSITRLTPSRLRWDLALVGRPAVALVWKNVTAAVRTFRPRALLIAITIIVVIAVVSGSSGSVADASTGAMRSAIATTFFSVFVAAVLTAPAWFRLDLRHDLAHLAFLKTAPLPAHTIVATEVVTAALIITAGMAMLFAPPAYVILQGIGGPLGRTGLALALLAGILLLGGINLLHVTLYNAVALWLPAWVPLNQGGANTGGAAVVGQVYITLIGIMLSLGVLLAAPVGVAWGVWQLLGPRAPVGLVATLCVVVALALVIVEWLGLARLLGRALDRLEPSDIPVAQS